MQTLTKILERIGEHFAWAGWMYGIPMPRPPKYPDPRREGHWSTASCGSA